MTRFRSRPIRDGYDSPRVRPAPPTSRAGHGPQWRSLLGALPAAVLVTSLCACSWGVFRGYASGQPDALAASLPARSAASSGMVHFALDDLGAMNTDALETHSLPWKVAVAALLLDRRARGEQVPLEPSRVLPVLQEFGFLVPDTILNWRDAPYPSPPGAPLGLLRGTVRRGFPKVEMEVASLGCASCHGGVTYDATGHPRKAVWLGLPNTSLNLGGYTEALYRALSRAAADPDAVIAALDTLYPDLAPDERSTLEGHVIPGIAREVPELGRRFGSLTPFHPGGPGTPNAVGSLKRMLGMLEEGRDDELSLAQIPDLGDRVLRTSLTVDGVYHVPGRPRFAPMTREDVTDEHLDGLARIVAFFTVPAMGARPHRIEPEDGAVRDIVEFLRYYRPPPFPGAVDTVLARRGRSVYHSACAGCHGRYSAGVSEPRLVSFPNRLIPGAEIGTDSVRWAAARPEILRELERLDYARHLGAAPTRGYVAPPLTGLWATAPYLHNASVPTLWHLMHPSERPERFQVGGHRLDFERVGVDGRARPDGSYRFPEDYDPWASPVLYDTRVPGQSNRGHEVEFESLTEAQKRALTEYLKLL